MKKAFKHGFLAILMLSIWACSKQVVPIAHTPDSPIFRRDTIVQVKDRIVTDTVLLGAEYYTVTDTVPCPPGLTKDSLVIVTNTVYKPAQKVPYEVLVRDTLLTVEYLPVTATQIMNSGYSWGERLAWLGLVFSLMIGWLKPRKNTPNNPPNFA